MKTLRYIGMALLAVVLSVNLTACSDDDDENAGSDLASIVSGVWAQDGDDNIYVLSKDGSGFEYTNPTYYKTQTKTGYTFAWEYKDNIFSIELTARYDDGEKTDDRYDYIEMSVVSYDKNKIVFKKENMDDNIEHFGDGESETWTWTRYQ